MSEVTTERKSRATIADSTPWMEKRRQTLTASLRVPDLHAIGAFAAIFKRHGFRFAADGCRSKRTSGLFSGPDYDPEARRFMQVAYDAGFVRGDFDWSTWKRSDEGSALLNDPERIAGADIDQLLCLVTVLLRQERFSEGSLGSAFEAGIVTAVVERARQLSITAR